MVTSSQITGLIARANHAATATLSQPPKNLLPLNNHQYAEKPAAIMGGTMLESANGGHVENHKRSATVVSVPGASGTKIKSVISKHSPPAAANIKEAKITHFLLPLATRTDYSFIG